MKLSAFCNRQQLKIWNLVRKWNLKILILNILNYIISLKCLIYLINRYYNCKELHISFIYIDNYTYTQTGQKIRPTKFNILLTYTLTYTFYWHLSIYHFIDPPFSRITDEMSHGIETKSLCIMFTSIWSHSVISCVIGWWCVSSMRC